MTLVPASTNGPQDRRRAKAIRRLGSGKLPTVRAMALAWRNGLGAVLAALIGFGLIKGRTDVGDLAAPYAAAVGALLVLSILAGGTAAALLLRAAHGSPNGLPMTDLVDSLDPEADAERLETEASLDALRRGRWTAAACAVLLISAVGLTWYGPGKDATRIVVLTPQGERCGSVQRLEQGVLTLKTNSGEVAVRMAEATGIRTADSCGPAKP